MSVEAVKRKAYTKQVKFHLLHSSGPNPQGVHHFLASIA